MVLVPSINFTNGKNPSPKNTTISVLLLRLTIIFLSLIPLYYFLTYSSSPWLLSHINSIRFGNTCNLFRGKWVYYPKQQPHYTNFTCPHIFDQQNCMKFGRPDSEFLKWKWKPENCELPEFAAVRFLEIVKGKSMAFVGDSVGRNQMQSLLCLLASVANPTDVSYTIDPKFKRFLYKKYNFTLASFWSPYIVKAIETSPNGPTYNRLMNLYLDQANPEWSSQIEQFDYVIISAGRWFFGPQIYYQNGHVVGCHLCHKNDIKNLTMFYGYRRAFREAFKTLLSLESYKGVTFLRTLSPAHFENGEWNKGGECKRTEPASRSEAKLTGADLELYLSQVEEVRAAEREGRKRGLKFRLMDISEVMVVRGDGHPNHFRHWPHENVTIADCVHWCLPGPIDTWNQILFQMLKDEK
ncbi:hypothetical protein UlMin_014453 [Ulmus minor]